MGNHPGNPAGENTCSCILDKDHGIYTETFFQEALRRERLRSERSGKPFALVLVDAIGSDKSSGAVGMEPDAVATILRTVRETDVTGWCRYSSTVGIVVTDGGTGGLPSAIRKIERNLRTNLQKVASRPAAYAVSSRIFPDTSGKGEKHDPFDLLFYPEVRSDGRRKGSACLKRTFDIAGSLLGLVLFAPLFIIIALLVKLTSKGPVLFKQERFGQYGEKFVFLKFRSMYVNNDDKIHREYVRKLIEAGEEAEGDQAGVYKIQNDPRVTPIGRFLRKTSLDELPQFINVLKGDMALVGPRPPIRYEVEMYEPWHRYRLMGAKPGITGLWQVHGRSRTKFDGMVRLDIAYIRTRSLWLDLKILLQTPLEVLKCRGAH